MMARRGHCRWHSSPAACFSLGLVLYSERGRLFRRLIPPGGERVVDLH
jgi:hypothetical protein